MLSIIEYLLWAQDLSKKFKPYNLSDAQSL